MFYDNLKKVCKQQGTSVTAVIKDIGLDGSNGTWWKKGSFPSADILIKLSKRLDVSVDYLLGITDNINSHKSKTERSDAFMGQYSFRVNVDELFNADLKNDKIKEVASMQLNYGWKLIRLEEENGQRFLVLEWGKEGRPDIDPFERNEIRTSKKANIKGIEKEISDIASAASSAADAMAKPTNTD